jgi:flagellar assembly protein FliH
MRRVDTPDLATSDRRELRRLSPSTVVTTNYARRSSQIDPVELVRVEAVREGYADGYAEGLAMAYKEATTTKDELSRRAALAVDALALALRLTRETDLAMREELQSAAPRFAFTLVEELLAREMQLANDPGREAIIRALALDEGTQLVTVRMHPSDVATLGELTELDLGREVRVFPDPAVELGGALVEVGNAILDARLSTALERVRRVLIGSPEPGAS